ncbi:alanine acetyltransferase [Luteimicrobium album]|uniref:Alanine acetyltransferase n=1 Tax=Luteimicrobium album TaxID=1054550 RepID=A0ABQ6HYI1_9MICO|nr:GNAT family N-acetyltransferase [Luteimicrobium album]GMA23560.1 alanine acetyltransferase [Luteimicrobium album]
MLVVTSPRVPLPDGVVLRLLAPDDARALAAAYARNAEHLAPWEPARADDFATERVQAVRVENLLAGVQKGSALPLVLVRPAPGASADDEIVGTLTVSGITRGAFESADLGYWTDRGLQGRGIMSAAVSAVVGIARDDLGLHRLQAGTLPENERSQRVLARAGFERFGLARDYLRIAGRWRDHVLFQRILHD